MTHKTKHRLICLSPFFTAAAAALLKLLLFPALSWAWVLAPVWLPVLVGFVVLLTVKSHEQ